MNPSKDKNKECCAGCLCRFFRELRPGDTFLPVLKGQSFPSQSLLTFISFNEETCCVTFDFELNGAAQLGILDCSKIAGVIPNITLADVT